MKFKSPPICIKWSSVAEKIVESENPAFENEGNTEKTQDKSGKAIAILSDTDRATSEDLDGEVTSNANVAPADI